MSKVHWLAVAGTGRLAGDRARRPRRQARPYIGFVYPAGGQQGTTFQIRLGGQGLDDVNAVLVTGTGVSAKVVEYYRRLSNQEMQLLSEQLKELKQATAAARPLTTGPPMMTSETPMMTSAMAAGEDSGRLGEE